MSAGASTRFVLLVVILLVAAPAAVMAATGDAPTTERAQQILEENRPLANNGDANAQYNLGVLYDKGYGVERDYAKARQWYEKAAAQHYPRAEHNLGIMYEVGKGVARDPRKAAHWFRRGADDGETASQNNLAVLYMKGEGVARNAGKAAFWAARAAAGGSSPAIDNLPRIIADLPHIHANADDVNVRDQPSQEARVADHVDSDTLVVVLARRDDWTQILLPNSYTVGWVVNFLLSDSPAPLAATTAPEHAADRAGNAASSGHTLPESEENRASDGDRSDAPRGEPSSSPSNGDASDTSAARRPKSGSIRPEAADLAATKAAARQIASSAAAQSAVSSKTAGAMHARVGVSAARVRARAGSGGRVIGQLYRGDRVKLLDERNGWRRVQTPQGMQGWIAGYLLVIP